MSKAAKVTLIVVAAAVVVFCAGSLVLDRALLGQTYARQQAASSPLMLTDADVAASHPSDDVSFQLEGSTVRGHVYRAADPRALVVFRHGIFSQHQDYLALIVGLVDKGYSVFAYDAIGCGESDGDSVIGFAQSPIDVRAAVRFADESGMARGLPILLFGHSWGGYGVAAALGFDDVRSRVSACVTMSGFDTPTDIIFASSESSMGAIAVTQRPFIRLLEFSQFQADADRSASRAVNECGLPVLVVHGSGDVVVPFDGPSIIAERDGITNPLVEYSVKDEPGRDGHNSYFYSPESQAYLADCGERLSALTDEHGDTLPDDVLADFLESVDKRRANTADPALMDEIDAFYTRALS